MLGAAKGILLDWDGCVALNNQLLPFASKLIAQHADRIAIVSNNSTNLPDDFAEILACAGVRLPQERILLAGVEAVRYVAADRNTRVMLLSAPRIRHYARALGMTLVHDNPAVVLLMRDVRFSYAKLELAANALRNGAKLIVTNADVTHPGPGNLVVPETGALLAALLACVGETKVDQHLIGKPSPLLFQRACACLCVAPQDAVMIGDNPATDAEGARNAGIRSILIGGSSQLQLEHLVEHAPA
jgi:HAD superfamily hydrolase (TIGR01450 family)